MKRFLLSLVLALGSLPAVAQVSSPVIDSRFANWFMKHNTASPVVAPVSDFTAVADSSGSLAGTYFTFHTALDAACYAPWYKVSGTGTAPVVTGCTAVEVDVSTDDTAATVAGNTRTALNTTPYTNVLTVTGATTHVILTSLANGAATAGNVGTSGFSVSNTAGVSGTRAIADGDVQAADQGWRICNDGVQTSTWLAVGPTSGDPTTTGQRLGKGQCYLCLSCPSGLLKTLYVSSQAASDGYSIVQFKQ